MQINKDRQTALLEKRKTYQGRPCKWGHSGIRSAKDRTCLDCKKIRAQSSQYKELKKRYNRSDIGKQKQAMKYRKSSIFLILKNCARERARKAKLPFNLTVEFIISIWPKDNKCPIMLREFNSNKNKGLNRPSPDAPSIDRIIPEKGYVKENVQIISHKANTLKNNITDPLIFKRISSYIEESLKKIS